MFLISCFSAEGYLKRVHFVQDKAGRAFYTFPAGRDHLVSNLGDMNNCLSRDYQLRLQTNLLPQGTCGRDVTFICNGVRRQAAHASSDGRKQFSYLLPCVRLLEKRDKTVSDSESEEKSGRLNSFNKYAHTLIIININKYAYTLTNMTVVCVCVYVHSYALVWGRIRTCACAEYL